jgi:pilus assembly protein Flp/PilA
VPAVLHVRIFFCPPAVNTIERDRLTVNDAPAYGAIPSESSGESLRKEVPSTMSVLNALIASFRRDEEGQGLAEYALILALIAIVAIIALIFLGTQVSTILSKVGNSI